MRAIHLDVYMIILAIIQLYVIYRFVRYMGLMLSPRINPSNSQVSLTWSALIWVIAPSLLSLLSLFTWSLRIYAHAHSWFNIHLRQNAVHSQFTLSHFIGGIHTLIFTMFLSSPIFHNFIFIFLFGPLLGPSIHVCIWFVLTMRCLRRTAES